MCRCPWNHKNLRYSTVRYSTAIGSLLYVPRMSAIILRIFDPRDSYGWLVPLRRVLLIIQRIMKFLSVRLMTAAFMVLFCLPTWNRIVVSKYGAVLDPP